MRNNDEIMDILDQLKDDKKLSISEIARRTDMAKSTISRYFNRTREFPVNKADDFARVFNVTPEYILGLNNNESKNTDVVETIAAHIDENVSDEEMKEIINYIEFIKSKK